MKGGFGHPQLLWATQLQKQASFYAKAKDDSEESRAQPAESRILTNNPIP